MIAYRAGKLFENNIIYNLNAVAFPALPKNAFIAN